MARPVDRTNLVLNDEIGRDGFSCVVFFFFPVPFVSECQGRGRRDHSGRSLEEEEEDESGGRGEMVS